MKGDNANYKFTCFDLYVVKLILAHQQILYMGRGLGRDFFENDIQIRLEHVALGYKRVQTSPKCALFNCLVVFSSFYVLMRSHHALHLTLPWLRECPFKELRLCICTHYEPIFQLLTINHLVHTPKIALFGKASHSEVNAEPEL